MLGFAAASADAGLAPTMALLIGLRAVQGAAAAVVLVAAFELLTDDRHERSGRKMWTAAAIFGAAIGPALGGAVTELLDCRAIFLAQAPVVAAAALICRSAASARTAPQHTTSFQRLTVATVCLGLLSAALTGVLFLVVLLLISGWALSPLEAAAVVSTLPIAGFLGTRVPCDVAARAIVGSTLVGAGVLSLAFLPTAAVAMTLVPQLIAGFGMGMALPALAGALLPERTSLRKMVRTLSVDSTKRRPDEHPRIHPTDIARRAGGAQSEES